MNEGCTGTFEEILKGEISILVPSANSKEYRDLMQRCEEASLKWASGGCAHSIYATDRTR